MTTLDMDTDRIGTLGTGEGSETVSTDDESVTRGAVKPRQTKRARIASSEGDVDNVELFKAGMDSVIKTVAGSKASRNELEKVIEKLRELEGVFYDVIREREHARGRLAEREHFRELLVKLDDRKRTHERDYCSVASSQAGSSNQGVGSVGGVLPPKRAVNVRKNYAVVVRSREGQMESDEVKKRVMDQVRKVAAEVKVCAVRTVKHGIAIEVSDVDGVAKLKGCGTFAKAGLKVDDPKKIGPKVVIYDVPDYITDDELMKDLYSKNLKEVVSMAEHISRSRLISRRAGTVILEVSPQARDVLVKEGRAFLGWNGCRVREIDLLQRCHRCYGVGHMARECKLDSNACRKCGKTGHLAKDCTAAKEVCRNCRLAGKPAEHSVFSRECPYNAAQIKKLRSRIAAD